MPRRSLPLALTITVHLLLLACFYLARPQAPQGAAAAPQRYMLTLVRPTLPPPVKQEIKKPVVRTTTRPQPLPPVPRRRRRARLLKRSRPTRRCQTRSLPPPTSATWSSGQVAAPETSTANCGQASQSP